MARTFVRIALIIFGGMIASRLVEMFLSSERGRRAATSAGLGDLTTHQGVELSQRYARSIASTLGGVVVGFMENSAAAAENPRRAGWPERIMTGAQIALATATLARTVSDFIEERRRLLEEGRLA